MMQRQLKNIRSKERGNVLFLILIAVALFAALSYAVTSSSRSGGGDANEESSLVNSASLTQYPAGVRTSIVRMLVSKGLAPDELAFNQPPFTDLDSTAVGLQRGVFHPEGGGAVYAPASADVMANDQPGPWYFNGNFAVEEIGAETKNDIVAFLPGIKRSICEKINTELGIGTLETSADVSADYLVNMEDDDGDSDSAPIEFADTGGSTGLDDGNSPNGFAGVPYGCFRNGAAGDYVYYHVLVER